MFAKPFARRVFLLLTCIVVFGVGNGKARAEYPDHPITVVIAYAPGAFLEIVARMFAPQLTTILGQPIIVVNKPGADGMIGLNYVANSAPDGYTIVLSGDSVALGPALHRTFPYDPTKGIRGVALIGHSPVVLGVSSKLSINDYKTFVDYARKNSGKLNAAASGNSPRLAEALLGLRVGFKTEIISFDGTAQSAASVATGESDFSVQDYQSLSAFAQAGSVKLLFVAGDERYPSIPDVPSGKELGLNDYVVNTTSGIFAPGGTPDDVVNKLNAAFNKIIQMPDMVKALTPIGMIAADGKTTPQQFNDFYLHELSLWKSTVTEANIPMVN